MRSQSTGVNTQQENISTKAYIRTYKQNKSQEVVKNVFPTETHVFSRRKDNQTSDGNTIIHSRKNKNTNYTKRRQLSSKPRCGALIEY